MAAPNNVAISFLLAQALSEKPSRIVAPYSWESRNCGHGSILITEKEVIRVVGKNMDSSKISYSRIRCKHPSRKFKDLLPGSRIVRDGLLTWFCGKNGVSKAFAKEIESTLLYLKDEEPARFMVPVIYED